MGDQRTGEAGSKRVGRKPVGNTSMTSTERNRRRLERLAATAAAANHGNELLLALHRDLMAANQHEWAGRLAAAMRSTAIKSAAEYTRRHAGSFAQDSAEQMGPEASRRHREHIEALAGNLDALSSETMVRDVEYVEIEAITGQLQHAGFFVEPTLVSAMARAFTDPPLSSNLKNYLMTTGYTGAEDDAFDVAIRDVR